MSLPDLAIFIFLLLIYPKSINTATQSLYDSDIWKSQRACAKNCFWWSGSDWLAGKLSCDKPAQNACYCRPDLEPMVKSTLSSCINTECGSLATVDIASATSIYKAYCANADKLTTEEVSVVVTSVASPVCTIRETVTTAITDFAPELTTSDLGPIMTVTVEVTGPEATKVLVPDPTSGVVSKWKIRFGSIEIKGIWHLLIAVMGLGLTVILIL